jgi:CHASE2 domain-containing sensor protein
VLVNIGTLPRAGVGELINIINKYDPKVIGIDTFFKIEKDDMGDSLLEVAFAGTKNLVLASKLLISKPNIDYFDSMETSLPRFNQHAELAFANLIAPGAIRQNDLKNTREFAVQERVGDDEYLAFAAKLVQVHSPDRVEKLLKRGNNVEVINFRGNVMDFGGSRFGTMFYALDIGQVFMEDFDPTLIKGKIVIFCYLGAELGDELTSEDKYYTPMNAKYAGKSTPDMFGGVIHANIAAMIMNEDYIDKMTETQAYLLALIILFINVSLFTLIYKLIPVWYDGTTKLLQLAEVMFLMFVTIQVFDSFNYELDLTYTIIAVLIAGDALEVYFGVVKNAFSRQGRRELTKVKRL